MFGTLDGTIMMLERVCGTERIRHVFRPRMRKQPALNVLICTDSTGRVLYFDATCPGRYELLY